jgi:hypothetical protein
MFWTWFAGFVSAHLFWLLVFFGVMVWDAYRWPSEKRR